MLDQTKRAIDKMLEAGWDRSQFTCRTPRDSSGEYGRTEISLKIPANSVDASIWFATLKAGLNVHVTSYTDHGEIFWYASISVPASTYPELFLTDLDFGVTEKNRWGRWTWKDLGFQFSEENPPHIGQQIYVVNRTYFGNKFFVEGSAHFVKMLEDSRSGMVRFWDEDGTRDLIRRYCHMFSDYETAWEYVEQNNPDHLTPIPELEEDLDDIPSVEEVGEIVAGLESEINAMAEDLAYLDDDSDNPGNIPDVVYVAMLDVREEGRWNMFDRDNVIDELAEWSYSAHKWMTENRHRYMDVLTSMMDWEERNS